jgi:D-serine deaminase-like pyridoxal phosphate-dependent protein
LTVRFKLPIPAPPRHPEHAIETPALVVDVPAFERNVVRMADATRNVRLRPHAKSHKCAAIARTQIAHGAVGICCQKTDEAAAFVDAGITDVLVTNEVVAPSKIARLAHLATRARIGVLVDAPAPIALLSKAAAQAHSSIDVYVEIDVGAHRCGVAPGAPALALADAIGRAPGLRFRGLQAYQGSAQHLRDPQARRDAIARAISDARRSREAIVDAGIACDLVTGAGTGTWQIERDSGTYDELQPGSYVFMDVDYARNIAAPSDLRFEQSLFVLASVVSAPSRERAVVDAGLKALSFDSGLPLVHGRANVEYTKASDEHGVLRICDDRQLALNERLWLVPGHCDPTVNLYDFIVAARDGVVEAVWPIDARGALG